MQFRRRGNHMSRPTKDAKVLNIRLDIMVSQRLDDYCQSTGITKTTAIEKILTSYFDDRDEKIKKTGEKKLL